jgi:hypothetical protein
MRSLAILSLFVVPVVFGQPNETHHKARKMYQSGIILPGKGIGDLKVGISTSADITRVLGETPSVEQSSKGKKLDYPCGITFDTDSNDKIKKIYFGPNPISTEPFLGSTDSGLKLGDAGDLVKSKNGKPTSKFTYGESIIGYAEGISFVLDKKSKTIKRIYIYDPNKGDL